MAKLISQISDSSGKLISQISDSSVNPSQENKSIFDKYSDYAKHYTEIYGNRVAILMMVGSFYEIYGQRTDPCFSEIVSVCQLNTSEKKNVSIFMAGFPEYTLEKYLQLLSAANFTSVVIVQDEDAGCSSGTIKGAKKKHSVLSIYSPGTYVPISVETSSVGTASSNNIMCVWLSTYVPLHKTKSNIVCGISILNMFTGKSHLAEHIMPFENNATTFDEIERLVSVHNPCEVIFLYDLATVCSVGTSVGTFTVDASVSKNLESKLMKRVKTYCGVTCDCVHEHHIRSLSAAQNCEKTQYLTYTLESVFGTESYATIGEFNLYPTATKSYCFLLNFVKEHNPALIQKICAPTFANSGSNAVLANHALKQLNIIDDHSADSVRSGHLSSVLSFLNRACTTIGRRRIKEMMTTPTFDEEWLNREYDIVEAMMKSTDQDSNPYDMMMFCRKQLTTVIDLEKVLRQIVLKRVPTGIIKPLYASVQQVQQMDICLKELGPLTEYLKDQGPRGTNGTKPNIDCVCDFILKAIEAHIEMSKIDENGALNIFKKGIDADMDRMVAEYAEVTAHIDAIQGFFNMIMRSSSNSASNDDTEYVKICSTEKSGSTMQLTKTRAKTLKHLLEKKEYLVAPWYKTIEATGKFRGIPINFVADVKFKGASTNNDEIVFDQLTRLFTRSFHLELSIAKRNGELYASFVSDVLDSKCFASIEAVVDYVRIIDVLQCRVYVAKKYKYCRPVIKTSDACVGSSGPSDSSYMKATGLRHVLIEHIQQHELYVANDVTLDGGGILLYGTNAVGKTSLIRSIGIAAIMAQTGFFVPCTQFVYKPYRAFFTRILGVDNLYKGLSTFGVEMSELRMILKNADEYSLILGDELCSGTETQSALSIFVAGLMDLHAAQSSFIFATHFHEIVDYEEITALERLEMKHMAVFYDRENDCLVYDRTLRDGAGDKMYGLEVCKSLHLPTEFLEKAFKIRSKYFSDVAPPLNHKTTKYNAKKVRGMCEMCETRISTETHHLAMQMNADQEGIINKNHAGNLMALCEMCHQAMHTTTNVDSNESSKAEPTKVDSKESSMVYYKTVKKVVKKKTTIGHMPYLQGN